MEKINTEGLSDKAKEGAKIIEKMSILLDKYGEMTFKELMQELDEKDNEIDSWEKDRNNWIKRYNIIKKDLAIATKLLFQCEEELGSRHILLKSKIDKFLEE